MAWATPEDLTTRYPQALDQSDKRLEALLADAEAAIAAELADAGISTDAESVTDTLAANLKAVECSMVARALAASSANAVGVSQVSQTAGPINMSQTFSNPTEDLYLTAADRKKLGITGGRASQVFYSSDVLGGADA